MGMKISLQGNSKTSAIKTRHLTDTNVKLSIYMLKIYTSLSNLEDIPDSITWISSERSTTEDESYHFSSSLVLRYSSQIQNSMFLQTVILTSEFGRRHSEKGSSRSIQQLSSIICHVNLPLTNNGNGNRNIYSFCWLSTYYYHRPFRTPSSPKLVFSVVICSWFLVSERFLA